MNCEMICRLNTDNNNMYNYHIIKCMQLNTLSLNDQCSMTDLLIDSFVLYMLFSYRRLRRNMEIWQQHDKHNLQENHETMKYWLAKEKRICTVAANVTPVFHWDSQPAKLSPASHPPRNRQVLYLNGLNTRKCETEIDIKYNKHWLINQSSFHRLHVNIHRLA